MHTRLGVFSLIAIGLAITSGCASSSKSDASSAKSSDTADKVWPKAPDGTPLAKVRVDEGMKEVYDTIGPPTDTSTYMTGKAWMPFYYGGDTHRMEARYKGQGRVIFAPDSRFSGDERVIEVQYDPTETGYK